jgi:hypothetical protein
MKAVKRVLTAEEVKDIFWEENENYKLEDHGEWISEGKYEHCDRIFQDLRDGTFWSVSCSRAGSYFTDYDDYFEPDIIQVEKKEVKTIKWVSVKAEPQ